MDVFAAVVFTFLLLSLAANYVLFIELKKAKASPTAAPPQQTIEATQILHDLTVSGASVVKVTRLDPNTLLMRSPRDRQ